MAELNRAAAAIAREVADAAGREVIVAGSMGPTGEIMEPMGPLSHAAAVAMFRDQAAALRDGGVDVLWVETMSSMEEFRAAAETIAEVGMPWCGTMSFDTAGRTMMGVTAADFVRSIETLPHPPLAFGANCGTGASDLLRTVLGFVAQGPERPIIAKGNAGIDHRRLLRHHAGPPAADARRARVACRRLPADAGDDRLAPRRLLLAERRQRGRRRGAPAAAPPRLTMRGPFPQHRVRTG